MFKIQLSNREIAILALFSTVWAVIEIYLGLFLKSVKMPFSGSILTFIGLLILFLARDSVPKRGTAILMGLVTSFLKLIYLGGFAIYPVLGILIEVILVEIGLSVAAPKKNHFVFSGALALMWALLHPFFAIGLLAGWSMKKVYNLIISWGAALLGLQEEQVLIIIIVLIVLHFLLGIFAGLLGWRFSHIINRRTYIVKAEG